MILTEVSPEDQVNFQLKWDILLLAAELSAASPTVGVEEFLITREDLRGIDISDQNVVLQRRLDVLWEIRNARQPPESDDDGERGPGDVAEQMRPQSSHHTRPIFIRESPETTVPDAQRKPHLTLRCRTAVLCWLKDKAADNTFQPPNSGQLLKAACAFLKFNVLDEVQEQRLRYARPSRFSRLITHRDNLWSAFQHLRSVPAGETHALSIEHLSTKPSRGYA